jgi:hypothetical protein
VAAEVEEERERERERERKKRRERLNDDGINAIRIENFSSENKLCPASPFPFKNSPFSLGDELFTFTAVCRRRHRGWNPARARVLFLSRRSHRSPANFFSSRRHHHSFVASAGLVLSLLSSSFSSPPRSTDNS